MYEQHTNGSHTSTLSMMLQYVITY